MKEIGELLKEERETRGFSLDFIQEETKIGRAYLRAMEAGEFDRLPGDPYTKGFIRSYARAIHCDPVPVIERYNQLRMAEEAATYEQPLTLTPGRRFLTKVNQTLQWFGL